MERLRNITAGRDEGFPSRLTGPSYEYPRRTAHHLEWLINEYGALRERLMAWESFQRPLLEAVRSCHADIQSCRNDFQQSEQRSIIAQNLLSAQLDKLKQIGDGNAQDIGCMLQYLEGPEGSQGSDDEDQNPFTVEGNGRVPLRITVPKDSQDGGSGIISP